MVGDLTIKNGHLSISMIGPSSGFSKDSKITIIKCGGVVAGLGGQTFGGTNDLSLSNVSSGDRLVTTDGKASFVVTLANDGLEPFFRHEPLLVQSVGGITLSQPLFGPEFGSPSYTFAIGEGAVEGTAIGALEAFDPEGDGVYLWIAAWLAFRDRSDTGRHHGRRRLGRGEFNTFRSGRHGNRHRWDLTW